MAAGFETRIGQPAYHAVRKSDAPWARLNYFSAQSGDAFSLLVAKASVLTSRVVRLVVLAPRFGVNRSPQRNRGWAVALILKPVPQRVGDSGRLIAFW